MWMRGRFSMLPGGGLWRRYQARQLDRAALLFAESAERAARDALPHIQRIAESIAGIERAAREALPAIQRIAELLDGEEDHGAREA